MIKSNLILAEWVTHKLENNYITEVLPQESSEPQIRLPSLGTRRHEIIRLSKPVAFGHRNFIGLRETEAGSCPSGGQGHVKVSRCLAGSSMLRKTLSSLSADGWVYVPTLSAWDVPALEPTAGWVEPGLGEKMAASSRAHTDEHPQNYHCNGLCPCNEPQPPPASAGGPPIPADRSCPGFYEVPAFSLGSWCT